MDNVRNVDFAQRAIKEKGRWASILGLPFATEAFQEPRIPRRISNRSFCREEALRF